MSKIPKFLLFGENDPSTQQSIQPCLDLRSWSNLKVEEKMIIFRQLGNNNWIKGSPREILKTVDYLNNEFLRLCPGENLHKIVPTCDNYSRFSNESARMEAALVDFTKIFLNEKNEAIVFRMLTFFAKCHINSRSYQLAENEEDDEKKYKYIDEAFNDFDKLASCLNHTFEQFAVNAVLTRNGLVPRQDEKITEIIYVPTLRVLADPKWKNVSTDLAEMFSEYRNQNYPETITKAHRVVQRFLQILVGEEGKCGQGEVGKLFNKAKTEGIIPVNRFTEPIINVFQGFISSERATNSTAKPAMKTATSSDALLVMDVVMIFLQHCLQKNK